MIERFEKESAEAERKELERQAALEKKRVEDALDDAVAFRRALDIRTYVDEARAANAGVRDALPPEDFETWASWAVAQADRIDPVRTEAFRRGFVDGPGNKAGDRNRKAATKTLKTNLPSIAKRATRCAILCQTPCHFMPNGHQQLRGFLESAVPSNAKFDKFVDGSMSCRAMNTARCRAGCKHAAQGTRPLPL